MRTVWLNGEFIPETEARISIFDRALLFGQGVYEVSPVLDGHFCNWPHHAARLERSKAATRIADDTDWPSVLAELIARNDLVEGRVYLQITGARRMTATSSPPCRLHRRTALPLPRRRD